MDFLNWLLSTPGIAAAGWITLAVAVATFWIKRSRPQKVVCQETYRSFLARQEHLWGAFDVLFKGKTVERPSVVMFEITNEGRSPIENIKVRITVPESTTILYAITLLERNPPVELIELNQCEITLDYLNPRRGHKETVNGLIVCDGEARIDHVYGSGVGWSTELRRGPVTSHIWRLIKIMTIPVIVLWLLFSLVAVRIELLPFHLAAIIFGATIGLTGGISYALGRRTRETGTED